MAVQEGQESVHRALEKGRPISSRFLVVVHFYSDLPKAVTIKSLHLPVVGGLFSG